MLPGTLASHIPAPIWRYSNFAFEMLIFCISVTCTVQSALKYFGYISIFSLFVVRIQSRTAPG